MKTAVIALTKKGSSLAIKLGQEINADVFLKQEFIEGHKPNVFEINNGFTEFVGKIFAIYNKLVFIMACGIAVRAIAPYLKSKTSDPAVVVMDEKGKFAISLVSGHLGGANKLTEEVASKIGATPVITTATDVNEVIAFDMVAKENACEIENIGSLKFISSELVNGGAVGFYCDTGLLGELPHNIVRIDDILKSKFKYSVFVSNKVENEQNSQNILVIRPKNLILGIGCKRGIPKESIKEAVIDFLKINGKSILSLKHAATIDLKKDEEGIIGFCMEAGLDLKIISREKIAEVENNFTCSEFVKKNVSVASVAEPCAVLSGNNARLICKKTVYKGITLSLSEEETYIHI